MVRKVGMKEPARMALRFLVLMNVQKRRLHEGKRQDQIHQDGNARPHTHIVTSREPELPKAAAMVS